MPETPATTPLSARELLEALRPLLIRVHAERTLSPGKVSILRHLSRHGDDTTSALAAALRISPQGISLAARELEAAALIERLPDATDRRKSWIHLTPLGASRLTAESAVTLGWLEQAIAARLGPDEQATLAAALPALRTLAAEFPDA